MPKPVEQKKPMAPAPQAAASDAPAPEPKKFLGFEPLTWAKILPLGAMFFCILFNYTILRDTKVRTRLCVSPTNHTQPVAVDAAAFGFLSCCWLNLPDLALLCVFCRMCWW